MIKQKSDKITYEIHETDRLGKVITIYRDNIAIARIRQIGKIHPDCRLEWLSWKEGVQKENGIQFPMCYLHDITQQEIENIANKYLLKE
jgi:hypothetical protein